VLTRLFLLFIYEQAAMIITKADRRVIVRLFAALIANWP
jgi:hypothetical protein